MQVTIRCVKCNKEFTREIADEPDYEIRMLTSVRTSPAEREAKIRILECPHCGTENRVRI